MEIQSLKNNIEYEKKKNMDLEAEMNEYKASCTCCKGGKVKIDSACQLKLDAAEPSCTDEVCFLYEIPSQFISIITSVVCILLLETC